MISRITVAIFSLVASLSSTDAFAAVGRTPGQFAVSSTGSAQYSIPIWTPPGIRGIQPNLALIYDSHLSSGIMGPGWTLSGLSAIARCNRTYAQDSAPAPITLTTADGLCLDGNRLRIMGTGAFQTEVANFSQVTASGAAGTGPSYFTVQGKDGLTYEYGNTTDSKILPCSSGCATPYVWALDKVTDRAGNQMTFTYYQAGGAYVPLSIQYTAPSGSTSFPYRVNFAYSTKSASDTLSKYIAGSQVQQTQQLSTITVTSSGTTVREYKLLYTTSSATLRATLTSIQECGGSSGTDCLPATSVAYQYGTAGFASVSSAVSGATGGVISVDIDGDGKQDIVYETTGGGNLQIWVQFAIPGGYAAPVPVATGLFLIDNFDGQAGSEILAVTNNVWISYKWNVASHTFVASSTGTPYIGGALYSAADVDGDGLPDLVELTTAPDGSGTLSVQLNTGAGTSIKFANTPVVTNTELPAMGSIMGDYSANSSVQKNDFDGDGRGDVIYVSSVPGQYSVSELVSRWPSPFLYQGQVTQRGTIFPVKWNDDNCTDLIVGIYLVISPCNGAIGSFITLPVAPQLALDWDGDGRTDALAVISNSWELYRSTGTSFAPGVSTGVPANASSQYFATDQDGDGLDDVLIESVPGYGISYSLHNGAGVHPDLATSFIDGYGNSVAPSYISIAQHSYYSVWGDQVFPYQNYIGPLYIAYQVTFSDPSSASGGTYYQNFYYSGASFNLQGRGFSGFGAQQRYDSRNNTWETWDRSRLFPYTGTVVSGR
jgi:hypothetical protein